jgi:hypothetical protein
VFVWLGVFDRIGLSSGAGGLRQQKRIVYDDGSVYEGDVKRGEGSLPARHGEVRAMAARGRFFVGCAVHK